MPKILSFHRFIITRILSLISRHEIYLTFQWLDEVSSSNTKIDLFEFDQLYLMKNNMSDTFITYFGKCSSMNGYCHFDE